MIFLYVTSFFSSFLVIHTINSLVVVVVVALLPFIIIFLCRLCMLLYCLQSGWQLCVSASNELPLYYPGRIQYCDYLEPIWSRTMRISYVTNFFFVVFKISHDKREIDYTSINLVCERELSTRVSSFHLRFARKFKN